MAHITPYGFQEVAASRAVHIVVKENQPSVLIQSATGSGKTVIASEIIRLLLVDCPSNRFLIVVPSMTLVEQFYNTLVHGFGIAAGVLHNSIDRDRLGNKFVNVFDRVVITMPDTFAGIVKGTSSLTLPEGWVADYVIWDEAHKNTAASSQAARDFFKAKNIGLTATPRREQNKDGEHLWSWYGDRMIVAATTEYLIKNGFIVAPKVIDRTGNAVVSDWIALTRTDNNKRTILITSDVSFARAYETAFRDAGISAQLIEGHQTMVERQKYFKMFDDGEIDVLCSVNSLCEGFDSKAAKHLIIERNMVSIALIHQCAGRVLRPFEGKTEGCIYDYSGIAELHRVRDKVWGPVDYAPEVAKARSSGCYTVGQFHENRIAYVCAECRHVYDAATHKVCVCGKPTCIQIEVPVREVVASLVGTHNYTSADYKALQGHVVRAHATADIVVGNADLSLRDKRYKEVNMIFLGGKPILGSKSRIASLLVDIAVTKKPLGHMLRINPHEDREFVDFLWANSVIDKLELVN